ncbi:MAG: hypothetical protein G01um101444_120 [Parcubacteria group bacterium Gr01-1014_44]|nr:MAG: hypothetical protein G01um101444_120 [Parcubacteria group bacterium Gr01-1014_44]
MSNDFPPVLNEAKKNIFSIVPPFYLLNELAQKSSANGEKWVVFWGTQFDNLPQINEKEFCKQTNLCLDYIRRNFSDYRLVYKPHPAEPVIYPLLNLTGFDVLNERTAAEFFVFKNMAKIKYVFSACSMASMTSWHLGLNSHSFWPLFKYTTIAETKDGYDDAFKKMPPEFFVSDLSQPVQENKKVLIRDQALWDNFSEILDKKRGVAWFILGDPGLLALTISMASLIRQISPGRKIGLIIEKHHRWVVMDMNEVKKHFDAIQIFPRLFYSLRPGKIWKQLLTARTIKNSKISSEDILIGGGAISLVENCFMSYFPKNYKIALLSDEAFRVCFGLKDPSFFRTHFSRRAFTFSNLILEPLLGLHRTIYREDIGRVANFGRYQEPVNDIYDQMLVF